MRRMYLSLGLLAILTSCAPYLTEPFYQSDWELGNQAEVRVDSSNFNFRSTDDPGIYDCKSSYFELPGQTSKKLHTAYVSPGKTCVVVSTVVWSAAKDLFTGTVLLCKRAYCSYVEVSSNEICFEAKKDHIYRVGFETSEVCSTDRDNYHFFVKEQPTGRVIREIE